MLSFDTVAALRLFPDSFYSASA